MAKYHRWFQRLALPFVQLAFHIHFKLHIVGRENIPEGGCVVCPNHKHNSDPPLAACGISNRHSIRIMAKKELFEIRGLSWLITWLGAFPVDRSRADSDRDQDRAASGQGRQQAAYFPAGHTRCQ